MKRFFIPALALFTVINVVNAQDDLVKKTSENATMAAKKAYQFTDVINLATTPIESQGSSGTCWSYSANSFLESEMIKAGKKPLPLSKIYTARASYVEKGDSYVRMEGHLNYGDGGEPHDVINMYRKYGTLPESVYTGLINGAKVNNFGAMQTALKAILDTVVKSPVKNPVWKKSFDSTLDAYLGAVPATFNYNGVTYTPQTFAKDVVGLNPDNYVEFISQTNTPYYQKAVMTVPDNWAFEWDWNIPPTELTDIVDNALKNGYTVAWGADVSEPYFSWPNGVAYVPADAASFVGKRLDRAERTALFANGPQAELAITPDNRQAALDNGTTTDDHGMHIVGISKDQNGKEYYIVKNSWGSSNDYKGFLNVSKAFVQYKTTSILVNKNAVPKSIKKKIGLK